MRRFTITFGACLLIFSLAAGSHALVDSANAVRARGHRKVPRSPRHAPRYVRAQRRCRGKRGTTLRRCIRHQLRRLRPKVLVVKSETTLDGRRLRASALLRNRTREQVRGAKGSLRWSVRGRHLQKVGSFKVPPLPARRRKRVNFLVGIPTNTPPGRYRVKVCVRVRHAFSCGRAGTIPVEEAESGPAQGVPSATPPASEQSASSGSSETSNPSGEEPESSEESVSTAPAHTSPAISVVGGTAHSMGETILREAKKWEGTPYCFAGGEPSGPSHGAGNVEGATQCPGTTKGFDCTGLTLYAVYRATGKVLTHDSTQAANAVAQGGEHIYSKAELEPGDLVYFGGTFSGIEHVGVYAGGGMMWDANIAFWIYPDGVHERSLASVETTEPFVGAVRFTGGTTTGGGGYDIAFQANTGDLWEVGSGPGAIGTGNWKLGMKAGTSPAIATTPGGGYDIAFQANTGDLWEVGSGPGAIGTGNWKLGMR